MRIAIIIILLLPICLFSQLNTDLELNQKLSGKENFQDIKSTVLTHYNEKLLKLSNDDSLERKSIIKTLKRLNRKFWLEEFYVGKDGKVKNMHEVDENGLDEKKRMEANNSNERYQPNNWNLQGPNSSDKGIGRVDNIVFHPGNPNIMFAGTPHGGLFKSTNGGNSWFPVGEFLPSLGIAGIAIHPSSPDIMYVLTGDANSSNGGFVNSYFYRANSRGVYKSYDGGNHWYNTGTINAGSNPYRGLDMIINPNDGDVLIISTTIGIYRTANGGNTWTSINNSVVQDLEFKPGDPNIVYGTSNNSFIRSTNNGLTWSTIATGNLLNGADRISIATTVANPNKVVLFAGPGINNTNFQGIFQSLNSGDNNSFTLITNTPNLFYNFIGNQNSNSGNGQSNYNNTVIISPTNENDIYVGGLCVWRSTDGGMNWVQISAYWTTDQPYIHPDIHDLSINPLNNKVYCGNDGGIYLYENNEWILKSTGLTSSQFYHFERENDEGDIWGGTQDNGIQEQNGGGGTYYMYSVGDGYDVLTDHDYLVDDGESDDVYFTVNTSILKDCNGTTCDISVPNNTSFFGNLAMSPDDEDVIYVGYFNGVWRSSSAGDNWGTYIPQPGNWCLSTTKVQNLIYSAGNNGAGMAGLFRFDPSTGVLNRTPPAPYNTNLKITDIDVDRLNENAVYVSIGGNVSNAKVFCSLDGGVNWNNITFDLPNVPVFCVKLDANNGLYIGTSIGVFYKPSGAFNWQPFSNGLPPTPITEIELWPVPHPTNGNEPSNPPASPEIWISTFGRGIWYTQQYTPNCPYNEAITGAISGNHYKEAVNILTSSQQIIKGESSTIKYNAGNKIILSNGFRAYSGCKFKTYLTGCGGPAND